MIAGVPYDAEVEYLESTGTQWIDTGYAFNSSTDRVELAFELLTTSTRITWFFGAWDSSQLALGSGNSANSRTFRYNTSIKYNSDSYYTNGTHFCLVNSDGASIDGHTFFNFANFTTTSHIYLYSIPISTVTYCGYARIWSYKHYRNGVLVRDFIPVRFTNEQGQTEGAMYDRVTKKLFRNAGTDAFVIGPDVAKPVMGLHFYGTPLSARDYVQDGLVAMWDGIENAGWGVHDPNATVWKDLCGNRHLDNLINVIWHDGYAEINKGKAYSTSTFGSLIGSTLTFEACYRKMTERTDFYPLATYLNNLSILGSRWFYIADGIYECVFWHNQAPEGNIPTVNNVDRTVSYAYADGVLRNYINGIAATNGGTTRNSAASGIIVGGGYDGRNASGIGYIYNVRVYSRALTADEIARNYAIDKKRFNLPEVSA